MMTESKYKAWYDSYHVLTYLILFDYLITIFFFDSGDDIHEIKKMRTWRNKCRFLIKTNTITNTHDTLG